MNPSAHTVDVDQLLRSMNELVAMLHEDNANLKARLLSVDSK
jgi:hypothetical protein